MSAFNRGTTRARTTGCDAVSGKAQARSGAISCKFLWRRSHAQWLLAVVAFPTLAAAVGPGTAPATVSSADEPRSDEQFAELGEIIVTAQRVESSELKTPISMDAIGGDQLTKHGLVTVADLNGYAQNLNVQENYNGIQFTVRGVTNSNGSTLNDPAVAFMQDGIYIPRQTTPMYLGFYDIARVEVLRGPQGTLWGRNTPAGVVNVITNSAHLSSVEFSGLASVGNYGTMVDQLMVNVPMGDRFAVRAAVSYDRRNSYLIKTSDDPFSMNPAKENLAVRLSALWRVSDDVTLNVKTDYANMDDVFFGSVPVTNFYRNPTTADPVYNIEHPTYFDGGTREQLSTNGFRQYQQYSTSAQTWGVAPQLDWVMGPLQMTYLSSFREQHEHYIYGAPLTPTYAMPNIYISSDETTSHELRFATTGAGPLQAQFGLYYFREALYDNWSIYDFPQVLHFGYLAVGSDPQINKSWAAFAQATYSILSPLRLTLGARESHDEKDYFSESVRNYFEPFSDPALNVTTPSFSTIKSSKLTWRAGLEYDAGRHTLLYATASTGYKAGGVNSGCLQGTSRNGFQCTGSLALPASILFYQPETITSYEAGIKSKFADGRIYLTADGFRYNYNNLQLLTVQQVAGVYITATENASKASVSGVEFDGIWAPNTHHEFGLGATYLNAKYGNYFPFGQGVPPNFNGRRLDDSPEYTVNLGYTYRQPLSIGGGIELGVHSYFSDAYYLSLVTIGAQYRQPAFHMTDVNATYLFPRNKWYLQAYARNLENKIVVVNANTNAAVPGAPLTYGLRVGFNY
jgi:iron complex outermembrane receptor protein